jgi:hypothetical protein
MSSPGTREIEAALAQEQADRRARLEQRKRYDRRAARSPLPTSPLVKATIASQLRGVAVNTTVVGAAVPQNVDEFGAEAGIDLTQVGVRSGETTVAQFQGARARLRGLLQGQAIGSDDTTVRPDDSFASQLRSPTSRSLFNQSSIPGTPGTPVQDLSAFTLRDITPPPGATTEGFSPGIQALAGFVQQAGVELNATNTPMGAADVHGAALDARGSAGDGIVAARGGDPDPTPHMDDFGNALREIKQLLQVLAGPQLAATSQSVPNTGRMQYRRGFEPPSRANDDIDYDTAGESDPGSDTDDDDTGFDTVEESESGSDTADEDEPVPVPAPAPAPAPTAAQAGSGAVAVTRQLDLVARAEAADALRRTPGIMKLIEARIFKFDDFLTNGSLDPRKLDKVRRVLAKRVDSTAESYKLAASARGYAPSGAAFPIEGLNNIVAGVRKVPGSKYVMYQGPQYVNG